MNRRILVVALLALMLAACRSSPKAPKSGAGPAPGHVILSAEGQKRAGVVVEKVERRRIAETIHAPGRLVFNEDRTWHIGAIIGGRVVAVMAGVGDQVHAGQVLARVFSEGVHEARAAYVKALAQRDRARSSVRYAREVRDRTQRLFDLKAASRQQVESAENQLKSAEAAMRNAEAEVQKTRAHLTHYLGVPLKEKRAAHADVNGVPASDLISVRSPADGVVVRRMVTTGTVVSAGQEAFTVSDPGVLWLIANVSEGDLSGLHVGQPVLIHVRAYPGKYFEGRIARLGEELDPTTRTLQVRVTVPNPEHALKAEMYASVEIERRSTRAALFVPESAEQEVNGQTVVFVRVAPDQFEARPIQIARKSGRMVEVSQGLAPGEWVVTRGSFLLKTELFRSSLAGE